MKELGVLDVTDRKRLVLSVGEFRGVERVDLRQYVKVEDGYIATRRGVNFSSKWIEKFIEMIKKLENE